MPGPLSDIRVLELSRVLAGPYCAMQLGDLGAEIIKIERPKLGDDTRHWGPPFVGDQSAYFLCCNRNKKSVTLNLASTRGQEIARKLAAQSDVLLENFLPGTLDGWGLGYAALSEINPRLVYCSITGFGQTGPWRDLPGYDILVQALGGVMSITGEPDGPPMKVGVAISDITAGLFAANAILAALVGRGSTGLGDYIDISLLDSTVAWLANVGGNYLATGKIPVRQGNAHANIVPYQAFETADEPIIVAVGNDGQWRKFCAAIEQPELALDARFTTNPLRVQNREALLPQLANWLRTRPRADWLARLAAAEIPSSPINTLDQVFAQPQLHSRQMLLDVPHPTVGNVRLVGSPCKLTNSTSPPPLPPPLLGQHTDQVLGEVLALDAAEIARLRAEGIV